MNNGPWKVALPGRNGLLAFSLLALAFLAYQPFWHIGYVGGEGIDADLHSWQGLRHIWTQQGQQTPEDQNLGPGKGYYPLTYTTFWMEYHLWGLNPVGYHLVSVLLLGLNAVILWLILRRLSVPGAWLAAALWVLHPVNVESVALIAESKNSLSGLFYLCSLLAALKYWLPEAPANDGKNRQIPATPSFVEGQRGSIRFYWAALILYVLALLSKTTTIPLPVVILLLVWWKRGRVLWRDVRPLLIFLVMGIAMGLDTMRVEHNYSKWMGNFRIYFALPLVDRLFVAGRDVWFYLGKLLWPHPLIFNYPRWKINPLSAIAWLQLLAVPALLCLLWLKRRDWGRPALVAFLYFLVLLAPSLSLVSAMFFRRSFVADHYQYLACMAPLSLAAAGIVIFFGQLGNADHILMPLLSAGLLSVLGILTWNQCRVYGDSETLYRTTIALNPDAWLIRRMLGGLLAKKGQLDTAVEQYQKALQIQPDAETSYVLASTLMDERKPDEATTYFQETLQIQPDYAMAYDGLGRACMAQGQTDEAIQDYQKALKIQPDAPLAWYNLGNAYIQKGQLDLAIQAWQKAVTIQPDFALAHNNLGNALQIKGQIAEAIQHWRSALAAEPNLESAQKNLAWVLATCPQSSLRNGAEAMQLAERVDELTERPDTEVLRTLAAACAENGDFSDAIAAAEHAIQDAILQGNKPLAANIQGQLKFYQNNQPFRDTSMIGH